MACPAAPCVPVEIAATLVAGEDTSAEVSAGAWAPWRVDCESELDSAPSLVAVASDPLATALCAAALTSVLSVSGAVEASIADLAPGVRGER